MKECRKIRPLLEWLAADELEDARRRAVEEHVRICPACSRELAAWRSLLAAAAEPDAAAHAEIQAIDWDQVTRKIVAGVAAQTVPGRMPAPRFSFAFLAVAASLVTVVGLGIFFWIRTAKVPLPTKESDTLASISVAHLQSGLARKEAVTYLQQSQVMLTGLLKNCASEEMAPWEMRLVSRQARELLLKKKYFQQYLSELEWSKVRNVSERIDWLSYEILQLGDRQLCDQVTRLQRIMEDERLLLKIRLLQNEFAWQPLREA
jgi:anti-sigma factor RsiW